MSCHGCIPLAYPIGQRGLPDRQPQQGPAAAAVGAVLERQGAAGGLGDLLAGYEEGIEQPQDGVA